MSEQINQPAGMFDIDPAEITRLFPGLADGLAITDQLARGEQKDEGGGPNSMADARSRVNREESRKKDPYDLSRKRIYKTAGLLVASYANLDEGMAVVKATIKELGGEDDDFLLGGIRLLAGARQQMRGVAQQTGQELQALRSGGSSYTLLKILAGSHAKTGRQTIAKLIKTTDDQNPGPTLINLSVLSGSDVPRQLAGDLNTGLFDAQIARDMLVYADQYPAGNETLSRLHRLGKFIVAFEGAEPDSKTSFYERLAAVLGDWPAEERGLVLEARLGLGQALDLNLNRSLRNLKEQGVIPTDEDLARAFEHSVDAFINELIKRQTGPAKAELLQLRTRRRTPKLLRVEQKPPKEPKVKGKPTGKPTPEVRREPIVLVGCNLKEGVTTDGVESVVEAYMDRIGQKGNQAIRADVEKMLHHLARTDLPPTQRRGIQPLDRHALRFGEDGKLWRVYEMQPSRAAGLSLRSNRVKDSRVYYIELDDKRWGVFGIGLRSEQDEFLRRTCEKVKQRH